MKGRGPMSARTLCCLALAVALAALGCAGESDEAGAAPERPSIDLS